jgi:hypothetical protein
MQRVIAAAVVVGVLTVAGLAGGAARSGLSGLSSSAAVIATSVESDGPSATVVPGSEIPADTLPPGVFSGIPGATDIALATGSPVISRERAIELTRPGTGTLVSAVYALLPRKFMAAVLNSPKNPHAIGAWIVTYTDVEQRSHGGAYVPGGRSAPNAIRLGITSVAINAATGELLVQTDYPKPL